jgi:cell division protein ZapE
MPSVFVREPSMAQAVRLRYEAMAERGELQPDERQRDLADALDALLRALCEQEQASKKSALGWLLSRGSKREAPRGLYIHGAVGRGKTLLMDLFFAAAPTPAKRRVHFHAFMAEVHERIARFRALLKSGAVKGDDPIPPVAAEIAAETRLLCFDEFAVSDIADAMILGRMFEQLFARGVTVVATSNVTPDALYEGGLNRALFLPFIALLKQRMATFHLDAPRDYRQDGEGTGPRYLTPLGQRADACLTEHFRALTGRERGSLSEIVNKGRRIVVPEAAEGVARFSFKDLCARPLGAGDYLKIAAAFPTILLADVPLLDAAHRNEAKRFINLIDTLYDNHVRLIVSAAAEPDALWLGEGGTERFEFTRTASRLTEMRSDAYWDTAADQAVQAARAV